MHTCHMFIQDNFVIEFGEGDDVVDVIIIIDSTLYMINLERNYNTIFFMSQDGGGGARYNNAERASEDQVDRAL